VKELEFSCSTDAVAVASDVQNVPLTRQSTVLQSGNLTGERVKQEIWETNTKEALRKKESQALALKGARGHKEK